MLPFTREQFFLVFSEYNEAVWPAQAALYIVALAAAGVVLGRGKHASRISLSILALLWAWMGTVYHAGFFAAINPAATVFAAAFLLQALLFAYLAARKPVTIAPGRDRAAVIGVVLMATGLLVYPVGSVLGGHSYPAQPTFGLPCPTTIYTLGLLLWMHGLPRYASVIPVLWVIPGTIAALQLGIAEDLLLGASLMLWLMAVGGRRMSRLRYQQGNGRHCRAGIDRRTATEAMTDTASMPAMIPSEAPIGTL